MTEYNVIASLEDKINQKAFQVFTENSKQSIQLRLFTIFCEYLKSLL